MPPLEKEGEPKIKSLRTYRGDVEEAVLKNKFSASSILTAEQKKRDSTLINLEQPGDTAARNKFFILVGSIMLFLGIITVVAVYYTRTSQQVVVEQKTKALIPFAQEKDIPISGLNRDQLINGIITEKQSFKLPVNSILYINTMNGQGGPAGVFDVVSLIGPQMPPSLVRSLDSKYMLGVYSFDTNEPFIILTTNDFASSFAGMLKWEDKMTSDLGRLFAIPQNTGTTTNSFTDEALRNKDLRILQDKNKKTILLYSFIDKNTLLITTNENVFGAVVGKYLISGQVQ